MNLLNIYNHLPVFLQNLAVTWQGFLIKRQRYGGNFKKYLSELEESQWFPIEKLKEIQWEKFKFMINHAYQNVPYYRNLFNKIGLSPEDIKNEGDLEKIPILEKQVIKDHRDDFIAQNINKKNLIPYTTGGTTGTPLTLFVTKYAIQYNFAFSEARVKYWAGVKSGDKLATFLGKVIVPPNVRKSPFWRYNKAYNQLLFSSFHMNDENLKYYLEKFNQFKPEILQGYVSTIHRFAKYILDYNKKVFCPKAILTSSETLFDWQKKDIEKAFGARVYNSYSLAEYVGFISECEKGGLHISPEYGLVELKQLANSNQSEIIATTLFNFAMPLIRYKTRDVVTLSEEKKCPCNRELPLVSSIEGRVDGMLITPEGNYISPAAMSLVFQAAKNIKESQIIQTKKDKIIVRIAKEKNFGENDLYYLLSQLRERLGKAININFEFVDKIERTKSGKFRFIISEIF